MAQTNLLPVFQNWTKSGNAETTITYGPNDYSCSYTATTESDYVRTSIVPTALLGKTLKIGYESFTSEDNEQWLNVRSYIADGTYTNIVSNQSPGVTEVEFIVPLDCTELRFYMRHEWDSDGFPATVVSISNVYMHDAAAISLTAINFHKITKSNLPLSVTAGEEHVYYTTDGTRVEMYITNKSGYVIPVNLDASAPENDDYYNAYTQQHIDERFADIKALTKGDYISFAVVTDTHLRAEDGDGERYNQIRDLLMVTKQLPVDYVVCLGDILSQTEAFDISEPRLAKSSAILKACGVPYFVTRGNHDDNSDNTNGATLTSDIVIQNKQWQNDVHKHMCDSFYISIKSPDASPLQGYFFADDEIHKHRMIFINTCEIYTDADGVPHTDQYGALDYATSGLATKQQLEWLINSALDMEGKTDWLVSFYSHMVPYSDAGTADVSEFHAYGSDQPELRQLIQAFKTGSNLVDLAFDVLDTATGEWNTYIVNKNFSAQGPVKVIGYFGGHIHDDCYRKVDGINYFVSTSTCADQRTDWSGDPDPTKLPPERNLTDLAMSVNFVIVDKYAGTVNVIKLGSKRDNAVKTSSDYTFTY